MVKGWGSGARLVAAAAAAMVMVVGCSSRVDDATAVKSTAPEDAAPVYQGPPLTTDTTHPVSMLEGGMPIYVGSGDHPVRCTAGFPLVGLEGTRYYLAAGHCARGEENAPVFVDVMKQTDSGMKTERVEIGRFTENQYPAGYVYDAADPAPFPDLALISAGDKVWPAPATSSIGGNSVTARGFPPDRVMQGQEHGQKWCWPAARAIGSTTECGQVKWVRENFIGIQPDNPDWAKDVGEAFPGTPVWSADYGSGLNGTVGIMSLKLSNGIYVVNSDFAFVDKRFVPDSAIGAKMPDGFVPNPPPFSFPR